MLLNLIIRNSLFSKQVKFSCLFLWVFFFCFLFFFGFWMLHELQILCMSYKWESKISRSFNTVLNSVKGHSVVKNLPANPGDTVSITRWGRSPGEGNGNTLQYSCLGESPGQRNSLCPRRVWHDPATKEQHILLKSLHCDERNDIQLSNTPCYL